MAPLQTVTGLLDSYPVLVIAIGLLMRAGLAWQGELSWYEYRTLHGLKRMVFPTLDRLEPMGFGLFVTEKGGRDEEAEYILTAENSVRGVVRSLRRDGGSLHLLSSIKRRPSELGDPYSRAHVVFIEDGEQVEVYVFKNDDGTTDVYTHKEASVTNPEEHLEGAYLDGDPSGKVADTLE